jgi:hypothetical protein
MSSQERGKEMTEKMTGTRNDYGLCLICSQPYDGWHNAEMYDALTAEFLPGEEQSGIVHVGCGDNAGWKLA